MPKVENILLLVLTTVPREIQNNTIYANFSIETIMFLAYVLLISDILQQRDFSLFYSIKYALILKKV